MAAYQHAWTKTIKEGMVFGLPANMQHDMHRLIGWTYTIGLHIDSLMIRTVGEITLPETEQDRFQMEKQANRYWRQFHLNGTETFRDELIARASPSILESAQTLRREAITLVHPNAAAALYPEFFQIGNGFVDKDGLVDYRQLLKRTRLVQPGVFHDPKRDLLLFAHRFFRRSLSHINKLNTYFLESFHAATIEHPELSIRLKLDPDTIGHPASAHDLIELEYWRGPRYSDDISSIPTGVTEHKGDENDRLYHGIDRTQIWWKAPESRKDGDHTAKYRTLEAEELIENASDGIDKDHFGCRYVHAEYSFEAGGITHFDGAIRTYEVEAYFKRIDTSIDKAGKQTDYTKLFRFDGPLCVPTWKKVLTDFFQGNNLIPEYLGALYEDKSDRQQARNKATQVHEPSVDALTAYISLSPSKGNAKTTLWIEDLLSYADQKIPVAETGMGAVHSYLHRRFDLNAVVTVGYKDGILNLARLHIQLGESPSATFFDELIPLVDALQQDIDSGIVQSVSIPLTWEFDCYMVTLTLAGNGRKVVAALRQFPGVVDPRRAPSAWIEALAELIHSISPQTTSWKLLEDLRLGRLSIPRAKDASVHIFCSPELIERIKSKQGDEDADSNELGKNDGDLIATGSG